MADKKKHVLWIGIDPDLLVGGLDTRAMFGCENYLKFNLNPKVEDEEKRGAGGGHDEGDDHDEEDGDVKENEDGEEPFKLEVEPKIDVCEVKEELTSEADGDDEETVLSFEQEKYEDNESETENGEEEWLKIEKAKVKLERPSGSATKQPGVGRGQTKRDHTKKIDTLKCERCQKTFCLERSYNRHIRIDSCVSKGVGYVPPCLLPALCPECGGTFKDRSSMKSHVRAVHFKEKPHKCDKCDKDFVKAYDLKRHVETKHSNSVHICDFCSKLFKAVAYLNYHVRRDHNEECVQCPKCNKNFIKQLNLDQHLENGICDQQRQDFMKQKKAKEAMESKRPCPHCDKVVIRKSMKKHIALVHEKGTGMSPKGKSQRCTYCEFHTPFEKKLKKHIDLMHPVMHNPDIESKERKLM